MRARVASLLGQRMAMVESPPDVSIGMQSFFGKTMVKGPGQKVSISRLASGLTSAAYFSTSEGSATWTMSGLSEGRPFAA